MTVVINKETAKVSSKINQNSIIKQATIPDIIFETFLCFKIVSAHHKGNGTRLLSPEVKCTSCFTS